jgi:hypothetical protein
MKTLSLLAAQLTSLVVAGLCGASRSSPTRDRCAAFGLRIRRARQTVKMGAMIDRLRAKGERIDPEGLAHLSPARYDRINPSGRYQFRVDR